MPRNNTEASPAVRKMKALPPAWFLIFVAIMLALHLLLPVCEVIGWPYRLLGVPPVLLGAGLNVWADALFKRARTTVNPFETSTRLVTSGPFRFSRHPMYLGGVLMLIGLAVLLGSLTPAAAVPAWVVLMRVRFVAVEEEMMAETFGEAYQEYRRRVRRWL